MTAKDGEEHYWKRLPIVFGILWLGKRSFMLWGHWASLWQAVVRRLDSIPGSAPHWLWVLSQGNCSMDTQTTHLQGKHIKAKTTTPAEMQVSVVSAGVDALPVELLKVSAVSMHDAFQSSDYGLLIPSLAARGALWPFFEAGRLQMQQPRCFCPYQCQLPEPQDE